uniref:DUOXA-like protein C06E1.3 n=2 Tax=Acrobeloides nanus TaxID=290746 RepID=A0A914C4X8_9BILA
MYEGWFSAFRQDFAPTSYDPITQPIGINIRTLMTFLLFILPYIAFLIILPGIREKRIISLVTITHQLGVGSLLMASIVLPYWNVGEDAVIAQFKAHSNKYHEAQLGVNVGLRAINVTMKYIKTIDSDEMMYQGMYFNERYGMQGVMSMATELQAAYRQGLPYPMLKVLEYFSLNQGSFEWGKKYRNAGYYADAMLWTAFSVWVLQTFLLALVPHHYSKAGLLCGFFTIIGVIVYAMLCPTLNIPFTGSNRQRTFIQMRYGSSFYLAIAAGVISIVFSLTLTILQYFRVYTISTCLGSRLDDTVGPKCKYGRNQIYDQPLHDVVTSSESSSCISEEGRLPSRSHIKTPHHRKKPIDLTTEIPLDCHEKELSNSGTKTTGVGSSGFQSRSSASLKSMQTSSCSSFDTGSINGVDRPGSSTTLDRIGRLTDDEEPSPRISRKAMNSR